MYWIKLTQANTGADLYVNMALVSLIAPGRKGGSTLMLTVREKSPESGKDTARLIPVVETPPEVMALIASTKQA